MQIFSIDIDFGQSKNSNMEHRNGNVNEENGNLNDKKILMRGFCLFTVQSYMILEMVTRMRNGNAKISN